MTTATALRATLLGVSLSILAATARCGPARDALVAPHHAGACDPGPADAGALPTLCRGDVPYACSPQGHLWPATPSAAPCPFGCVEAPDGARCRARGEVGR